MAVAAALAEDAVAIGRVAVHGSRSAASIRAQLAACPTPSVRRWVFVRRLTIATRDGSITPELTQALARLATGGAGPDVVVFPDFAALATSLARDLLGGVAASRWYWRRLGVLHRWSGAQAAIGLLVEQPLETWAVIERWHDEGLLAPIWRQLTASSAAMLLGAVGWAIGTTLPDRIEAAALPLPARLEPAVAFWRDAVAQATVPHVAIHAAAVLSLLRWDPVGLAMPSAAARMAALANEWGLPQAAATLVSEVGDRPPTSADLHPHGNGDPTHNQASAFAGITIEAATPVATDAGTSSQIPSVTLAREIPTEFGGVLFLINTLNRLGTMRRLLDWSDGEPPTGWQLLHDLARSLGAPETDELVAFLAEQIGEPAPVTELVAELAGTAAELYEGDEIWPGFLRQPGLLRATASHLDLYLHGTTIDIRIRRAGLDLDPAWVPWLGRVVGFHYPLLRQRLAL